jgi:tetratricopeptide (TPR) repeat protein
MKKRMIVIVAMALPLAVSAAEPARPGGAVVVQQVESESALKRLFDEAWAKLRSYGPKLGSGSSGRHVTVVAGVRGNESTGTQLNPYWKGDHTSDPGYVQEATAFNHAQDLADAGDVDKAVAGFEEFLNNYPKSSFKPNAQFALGLSYGAAGQKAKGRAALEGFIRDYPTHPLAADAKRMQEALR